jgi:hypothetical protein
MPSGWRITARAYEEGMIVMDEPFALWQNDKGEVWVLTAQPVEIEGEKSSVVEGSLHGQFPDE